MAVAVRADVGRPGEGPGQTWKRPDIQGLRAIAVLAVVLFHAGLPLPGGFVGVDVFFVVSGFVITAMLTREWMRSSRVSLIRFYVRRFKRLTPALALVVLVTMVLAVLILSPLGTQQDTSRTGIGALLLAGNLVIAKLTGDYFGLEAETNPLLHTWSLSVEEQFYLVFPLLIVGAYRIARRAGRQAWIPLAATSALGALSFGLMLLGYAGYVLPREGWLLGFYSPITRAWEFAAGAALALLGQRALVRSRALANGLGLLGGVGLLLSLLLITESVRFPGPITLLPVLATCALILAGSQEGSPAQRVLSIRPMVTIGDLSYSIYLWHWPFIVFASLQWPGTKAWVVPIAAAASVVPAVLSYRFVESPLRSMETPTLRRFGRVALPVVVVPLLVSISLWQAADRGYGNPRVRAFQAAVFEQSLLGCYQGAPLNASALVDCVENPAAAGKPIYLLGDSNAQHFAEGLAAAAHDTGRPVVITTTNSCPFLDVSLARAGWSDTRVESCRSYTRDSLEFLETANAGTVVISNIDTYWANPGYLFGPVGSPPSADRAVKLEALRLGLQSTIHRLRGAGHEVVLFQTIPTWTGPDQWHLTTCGVAGISNNSCEQSMPVERALARQGDVRTVVAEVGAKESVRVFDSWPLLCPEGRCSTQGPEYPRYYRDGIHLSMLQSRGLAPELAQAVQP